MKRHPSIFLKLALVILLLFVALLSVSFFSGAMSYEAFAAHPPPTPTPAPTPPPGTPWLLENYAQKTCDVQGRPATEMITYYGIWINGAWSKPITMSMTSTPTGTQVWPTGANPIPSGSSNGIGSISYLAVQIPSNTPLGTYTLQMVATDGKLTQQVPVTLVVQTQCASY